MVVCAAAATAAPAPAPFLLCAPVWASDNSTDQFVLLRSQEFKVRSAGASRPLSATLYFAAEGSPRPPEGTTQAKLLGAASVYVNGVLVTVGPGHNVPTSSQVRAARCRRRETVMSMMS